MFFPQPERRRLRQLLLGLLLLKRRIYFPKPSPILPTPQLASFLFRLPVFEIFLEPLLLFLLPCFLLINFYCLFSLILSNTLTKLVIELEREPTNLPNNSFLGGMLAKNNTLSFSINLFSKIPPKIRKVWWPFANLFEILAGATSSSMPKTKANCPGTFSLILFQKETFSCPKAILSNVFFAIFKLHPASFKAFLKSNISFEGTLLKSTKTTD